MSLFSGVGGLELGLSDVGYHNVVAFYESWESARTVLTHRHPQVPTFEDVRELHDLSGVGLVTAGFPCTDLSQAGRTNGLNGLASGLVRHVLELLPGPDWLLLENVPNMLHLGRGHAMTEITHRLEKAGYDWAYRVMDSRSFGLAQRRRRVYLLASRVADPAPVLFRDDTSGPRDDGGARGALKNAFGFYWTEGNRGVGWAIDAVPTLKGSTSVGVPSPPGVWLPNKQAGMRIVTPTIEAAETLQGFRPGWTDAAPVRDRWKLVGNAVSVPAAAWIGRGLRDIEALPDADALDREPLLHGGAWPIAASRQGKKKWRVHVTEWPLMPAGPRRHLASVLRKHGAIPLSHRATKGFRDRLRRSNLSYTPEFMQALDEHVMLTEP
jgi:DNA (cytosine-5)-methyltransferase 1